MAWVIFLGIQVHDVAGQVSENGTSLATTRKNIQRCASPENWHRATY